MPRIILDGGKSNFLIGGDGTGGDVVLHGHETTHQQSHDIAKGTVHFDGELAIGRIGGNRRSGRIVLHGHETIDPIDIFKNTVDLDGQSAHLLIGGNNRKGKILLFNDNVLTGGRLFDHNATIQLDAHEGVIRVKGNNDTEPTLIIDGKTGNCETIGDILFRGGADCAEEFQVEDISAKIEPGMVVTMNDNMSECNVNISKKAYDKRVVGVVSGAGEYRPAIILDKRESNYRVPIAMIGKVLCRVDASYSPIETGDLLTTSETPGYAMKAIDQMLSFGSIIGKALNSLEGGKGMIPILVTHY